MKKSYMLVIILALFVGVSFGQTPAPTAQKPTTVVADGPKDIALKKFVNAAASFYLTNAIDEASEKTVFATFSNPKGPWVQGEFYLYAYDFAGNCIAHGTKKVLIGTNQIKLRDSDGVFMIQAFLNGLGPENKSGSLSQKFKFPNPAAGGAVQDKVSWNVRVQSGKLRPFILGSGYYIPTKK